MLVKKNIPGSFFHLLARLNKAAQTKQHIVIVKKLGSYASLLDVLVRVGCIKTYVEYPDLLLIKLKIAYGTTKLNGFRTISNVSRTQRKSTTSFSALKKFQRGNSGPSFCVLATDKGLLTSFEAAKKKIGGKILFQII
jgi:ribosomal protein S8